MSLDESMRLLSEAADILNKKSDELNFVIREVEACLEEASVGLTCWLKQGQGSPRRGWVLGYTKIDSRWQLAVQHDQAESPVSLLKAARSVRVAAIEDFDALVMAMADRAMGFVGSIDEAKRAVELQMNWEEPGYAGCAIDTTT